MSRYPLLIMLALFGLSWLTKLLFPTTFALEIGSFWKLAGWGIALCGICLILVAAGLFRTVGTTLDPTKQPNKLVTTGIYAVTRNPMYLGMLMMLLGFPIIVNSWIGLISPLLFFLLMDRKVIPREEKVVEGVFGREYLNYKSQTRRWI